MWCERLKKRAHTTVDCSKCSLQRCASLAQEGAAGLFEGLFCSTLLALNPVSPGTHCHETFYRVSL